MVDQPLAYRYREVAIKTANPLQLIVILYDGAIQSLREAQEQLRRNDIARRARCANRAMSIVSELQACLNFKEGGDLAVSLDRLYAYMNQQIFKGNLEQAPEPFAEVVKLLENLRSAWAELASQSQRIPSEPGIADTLQRGVLKEATTGQPLHHGSLSISG